MTKMQQPLPVVGWREWIALPGLSVDSIKTKLDTGAKTSSLHAFDIHRFKRRGRDMVRFQIHPLQRNHQTVVDAEAALVDMREVRSSSGHVSERPVICTSIQLLDQCWQIELTLANRDQMGFRMLLGRQAIRGRFLVDSGASYRDSSRRPARH